MPLDASSTVAAFEGHFYRHAFATWLGLPLVALLEVLVPQLRASCHDGYPDITLVFVAFFLVHWFYSETSAWQAVKQLIAPPEMTILRHLGVLRKRKWKMVQGFLEQIDLYTDLTFPFIARSCGAHLTHKWSVAWSQSAFGHMLDPVILTLRFWGIALIIAVTNVAVTGLLGIYRIRMHATVRKKTLSYDMSAFVPDQGAGQAPRNDPSGEVYFGWAQSAETAMMPSVACICEEMASQKRFSFDKTKDNLKSMQARYDKVFKKGFANLEAMESKDDAEIHKVDSAAFTHYVALLLVKVIIGNVLQLWMQATFFALTFDEIQPKARNKLLVSMVISVVQAFLRCMSVTAKKPKIGLPFTAVAMFIICFAMAKVYFAFLCDYHVWNLTSYMEGETGCVDLSNMTQDASDSSAATERLLRQFAADLER